MAGEGAGFPAGACSTDTEGAPGDDIIAVRAVGAFLPHPGRNEFAPDLTFADEYILYLQ